VQWADQRRLLIRLQQSSAVLAAAQALERALVVV
jgi:hypothetical protein